MRTSPVFEKNLLAERRLIINQGGTWSTKTYSILQLFIVMASRKKGKVFSVVGESMPFLKKGAIRDFLQILEADGIFEESRYNRTEQSYTFESGSIIEFFSADNSSKVRGPKRDYLFINECNNILYETFEQLEIRTREQIYLDFNPVESFWVHERVMKEMPYEFIISTYLDGLKFLPDNIRQSIERRKETDPMWWKVFGLGQIGTRAGVIFPDINIVKEMPQNLRWLGYGMDFGFTNDPTTLMKVALSAGQLWIDERLYRTGMLNRDINTFLKQDGVGRNEICADNEDPKTITELQGYGWNIFGVTPQNKRINFGIDTIKRYPINITVESTNAIKEFRNWQWMVDRSTGKFTNVPVSGGDHCIDAVRYIVTHKVTKPILQGAPAAITTRRR